MPAASAQPRKNSWFEENIPNTQLSAKVTENENDDSDESVMGDDDDLFGDEFIEDDDLKATDNVDRTTTNATPAKCSKAPLSSGSKANTPRRHSKPSSLPRRSPIARSTPSLAAIIAASFRNPPGSAIRNVVDTAASSRSTGLALPQASSSSGSFKLLPVLGHSSSTTNTVPPIAITSSAATSNTLPSITSSIGIATSASAAVQRTTGKKATNTQIAATVAPTAVKAAHSSKAHEPQAKVPSTPSPSASATVSSASTAQDKPTAVAPSKGQGKGKKVAVDAAPAIMQAGPAAQAQKKPAKANRKSKKQAAHATPTTEQPESALAAPKATKANRKTQKQSQQSTPAPTQGAATATGPAPKAKRSRKSTSASTTATISAAEPAQGSGAASLPTISGRRPRGTKRTADALDPTTEPSGPATKKSRTALPQLSSIEYIAGIFVNKIDKRLSSTDPVVRAEAKQEHESWARRGFYPQSVVDQFDKEMEEKKAEQEKQKEARRKRMEERRTGFVNQEEVCDLTADNALDDLVAAVPFPLPPPMDHTRYSLEASNAHQQNPGPLNSLEAVLPFPPPPPMDGNYTRFSQQTGYNSQQDQPAFDFIEAAFPFPPPPPMGNNYSQPSQQSGYYQKYQVAFGSNLEVTFLSFPPLRGVAGPQYSQRTDHNYQRDQLPSGSLENDSGPVPTEAEFPPEILAIFDSVLSDAQYGQL